MSLDGGRRGGEGEGRGGEGRGGEGRGRRRSERRRSGVTMGEERKCRTKGRVPRLPSSRVPQLATHHDPAQRKVLALPRSRSSHRFAARLVAARVCVRVRLFSWLGGELRRDQGRRHNRARGCWESRGLLGEIEVILGVTLPLCVWVRDNSGRGSDSDGRGPGIGGSRI